MFVYAQHSIQMIEYRAKNPTPTRRWWSEARPNLTKQCDLSRLQGGDKLHGHLELWKQIYRSTNGAAGNTAGTVDGLPLDGGLGSVTAVGQDSNSFDTESLNGDISDGE